MEGALHRGGALPGVNTIFFLPSMTIEPICEILTWTPRSRSLTHIGTTLRISFLDLNFYHVFEEACRYATQAGDAASPLSAHLGYMKILRMLIFHDWAEYISGTPNRIHRYSQTVSEATRLSRPE